MQVFKKDNQNKTLVLLNQKIESIDYAPKRKPNVHLQNGCVDSLCCAKCLNPRCMFLSESEASCTYIKDFSFDKNDKVCPVDAIRISENDGFPIIDNKACIKCGVCVRRCPFGSLYFNPNLSLNKTKSIHQFETSVDDKSICNHNHDVESAIQANKTGIIFEESEAIYSQIYNRLISLKPAVQNHVVRDILISLNCDSSLRRIGDVYTRMDAIYQCNNCVGPIEIEFGRDSLDASRAILDDIAVLKVRYSLPKEESHPLVIFLTLPNARQGYWQVVKDIKRVESIKINTITIGCLFLLNWRFADLKRDGIDFYLDYDQMSLRKMILEYIKKNHINISNGFLGICEPEK